jgi:oxidoreductase
VRGATSGVGIAFAKLLKGGYLGVKLFGSTRNMDKADKLRLFGYDEIILDNSGKLETDESFDKVLELIGPATVKDSISHMSEGGIVCSTGLLGGSWYLEEFDPAYELRNSIYLTTFYSGNVSKRRIQEMFDYIDKYSIEMKPEKVFALEEIRDAHRYLEGKDSFGKVVVVNDR